jgi:tetratricopeptide (TPR) repeat protein
MTMTRILLSLAALALAACTTTYQNETLYDPPPFYARFLNTGSDLDAQIAMRLDALRQNPDSPADHNELGRLLIAKDFPADAAVEFERALNLDPGFYPAWYNLGLARASMGDVTGARRAFRRTVQLRKGHGPAHFELGLLEEAAGDMAGAVAHYAKALRHNPELMDVRVNPRILDSGLIHLALLQRYPREHAGESSSFHPAPSGYVQPEREAPSDQPSAEEIITPAPPVTDPGTQTPPPGR